MLRALLVLTSSILALELIVACAGGDEPAAEVATGESRTATAPVAEIPGTPTVSPAVVVIADTRWPTLLGNSLEDLYSQYDSIALGRVTQVVQQFDPRPGYLGVTLEPAPSGHPKYGYTPSPDELSRAPGKGYTVFAFEVTRAIGLNPPHPGATIFVGQAGGVWEGVEYRVDEAAPILQVGGDYLLALSESDTVSQDVGELGFFGGLPFAEYRIGSDQALEPLDDHWLVMPAVSELAGLHQDVALSRIEESLARATSGGEPSE